MISGKQYVGGIDDICYEGATAPMTIEEFLAVGAFNADTELKLTDITPKEPVGQDITVLENWKVTMKDTGIRKLHYHIPKGLRPEEILLHVQDGTGSWAQREFTVEDAYLITFPFVYGERGFALEVRVEEQSSVSVSAVASGAAALLIAGIAMKKRKAKKRLAKRRKS